MASYWVDRGYDVTVVTLWDSPPDFVSLPPAVRRIALTVPRGFFWRVRCLLVRWFERERQTSKGRPARGDEERAAGTETADGGRNLDGLRALYHALQWLRDAVVAFIVRTRLLGRRPCRYALLARAVYWPVRSLRRILESTRPDTVLSLLGATNIMTISASIDLPHRTVISERNDPSRQRLDPPWEQMRPVLYPSADAVSANSHGALASMRAYCPAEKLCYVPNPLILAGGIGDSTRVNAMLFLARLVPQKAPDVLIEAFARVVRTTSDWRLHLAGDGPMSDGLRARAHDLGLDGRVVFHGVVPDPTALLARCRIFVLPSRFEGTPNALLEAMAHRMPCIVSDASPGPLRLVKHAVNGLVVETGSVSALATAMERLCRDGQLRQDLGKAAFERVREFGFDTVGPVWDRILFPGSRS